MTPSTARLGIEMESAMIRPVLTVDNLHVQFQVDGQRLGAVRGVSFKIFAGETFAVVGESGSGKSVTALAVLGLVEEPGRVSQGSAYFSESSLLANNGEGARRFRGREIGMVFQDALAALNPGFTVGYQIDELFRVHARQSRSQARAATIRLLDRVGIANAATRANDYPYQFSGGMRQRVAIAMAIALNPSVIIADEPTTALDVTVQAQIMELLAEIKSTTGASIILITHDLAVVSAYADRLAVMYAGKIVEQGLARNVLQNPVHPYTRGLLNSVPSRSSGKQFLPAIPGSPPDLRSLPGGCSFAPRCDMGGGREKCRDEEPSLRLIDASRLGACHFAEELVKKEHLGKTS